MCIEKYAKRYEAQLYALFRVFVGLLFAQHGFQKILGWLGGTAQVAFSQMWFVGLLELVGGLAIAFGLFTRLFAFLSGLLMLSAFVVAHWKPPFWPIQTKNLH